MYKNQLYVVYWTSKFELMMKVYNPINDIWIKFDQIIKQIGTHPMGRLIVILDCLFLVSFAFSFSFLLKNWISIFEVKTEDRLMIPIVNILQPIQMQWHGVFLCEFIFNIRNKIIIVNHEKHISITYDVFTNKQEEFINNNICRFNFNSIYPFKYTLVSPK